MSIHEATPRPMLGAIGRQRSSSAPPGATRSQKYARLLAALTIQRFVRLHRPEGGALVQKIKALQAIGKWPTLKQIKALKDVRAKYLDDEALASGALTSTLYSDEQLVLRELCRRDPSVKAALSLAWTAFAQGEQTLSKDSYLSMARRIYLVLTMRHNSKARVSSSECRSISEKDFARDSNGKQYLTEADFHTSLFQLADVNTAGVSAGEQSSFILRLVDSIARVRLVDGQRCGWEWRDDRAIWAEASVEALAVKSPTPAKTSSHGKNDRGKQDRGKHHAPSSKPHAPSKTIWARLAWLAAFEEARRAEQAIEGEKTRNALERRQAGMPFVMPSTESEASAHAHNWASLTRGRPRGLLSQRLSQHLSSASALEQGHNALPLARRTRSLAVDSTLGSKPPQAPVPPSSRRQGQRTGSLSERGSLSSALSQARADAETSSVLAAPVRVARPRALSRDSLPALLHDDLANKQDAAVMTAAKVMAAPVMTAHATATVLPSASRASCAPRKLPSPRALARLPALARISSGEDWSGRNSGEEGIAAV